MTAPYDNDYGSPDMYEQGKVEEPTREKVAHQLMAFAVSEPECADVMRAAARMLREDGAEVARLREALEGTRAAVREAQETLIGSVHRINDALVPSAPQTQEET